MADKKQCEEVVKLYKQGKIQFDIAEILNISYTTVSNIIKAYQEDHGKIKREKVQRKEYNIAEESNLDISSCEFAVDKRKVYKTVVDGVRYIDITEMVSGL